MAVMGNLVQPTYPTNSLNFLRDVSTTNGTSHKAEDMHQGHTTPIHLNVLIVGAGIAGLSTAVALALNGHSVTVVEQAPALAEVGAGIQIPPNSVRLLFDWGLGSLLAEHAVEPENMTFRRWQDGTAIARTNLGPEFRSMFHAPYFVIHRAHLHHALHERAVELGVKIQLNCKVKDYDTKTPAIITESGTSIPADLIVASDGIKSTARTAVNSKSKGPSNTGFAAYRATVDTQLMRQDPTTAWLLEKPNLQIWIGPGRHAMTYTIAGGKQFNMVLAHTDPTDPATWDQSSALKDMQAQYEGWDPSLTKTLAMVTQLQKWPLMEGARQDKWVSDSGKVLILGDAAHAMIPFMSQGAAMAVEDAAGLCETLRNLRSREDLPSRLHVFEQVRSIRTSQMQEASNVNGKLWHFDDGPEQVARDAASRAEILGLPYLESSNQWSDPKTKAWAYGYDAVAEMRKALAAL